MSVGENMMNDDTNTYSTDEGDPLMTSNDNDNTNNGNHHHTPENDDYMIFGSVRGTFSPAHRARSATTNNEDTHVAQSKLMQACLLALLSFLVVIVVTFSFLAMISTSATTTSSNEHNMDASRRLDYNAQTCQSFFGGYSTAHQVNKPYDTNVLGLYRLDMSRTHTTTRSGIRNRPSRQTRFLPDTAASEAFFLRYYVLRLEVTEVEIPLDHDTFSTSSSTAPATTATPKTDKDNYLAIADSANSSSTFATTTTTVLKKTTRLMRPGTKLFKTTRALQRELVATAQHDILMPLKQRWTERLGAVKRHLLPSPTKQKNAPFLETTTSILKEQPTTALSLHLHINGIQDDTVPKAPLYSILGLYPRLDLGDYDTDEIATRRNAILHDTGNTNKLAFAPAMSIPKSIKAAFTSSRKTKCPTNLFCFYRLPPTILTRSQNDNIVCPTYCGRCLETKTELQHATEEYLQDPLNHTSRVAKTYGWPMNNWCTSLLTDFSNLFANQTTFNEPLHHWDVSSATTLRSMFTNAHSFNQRLSSWDVSRVQDLSFFLANATCFNQPLHHWDVAHVKTMHAAFYNASKFHQDLSLWNVQKVQDFSWMFAGASKFAADLSSWKTIHGANIHGMFQNATSAAQANLAAWNLDKSTDRASKLAS